MEEYSADSIGDLMAYLYATYKENVEWKIRAAGFKNPAQIDDLVGDVFLRALTSLKTRREPVYHYKPWLLKIAENVCNQARKQGEIVSVESLARKEFLLQDTYIAEGPTTESMAEIHERIREMQQHLDALPQEQREAALLLYGHGLTSEEIAQRTGRAPSTIRRDAGRGRKQLRIRLLHLQEER